MTVDLSRVKVYLRPGHTDLRKAVNGLTVLIQDAMKHDPFSGSVYLFCNREKRLLKAVWWDLSGFWLSQKRLEEGKFPWPAGEEQAEELTEEQVRMLLRGIDFWKAHKALHYQKVS
jgi:transposase